MTDKPQTRGIGMTSQRTRDRLIERLRAQGITSAAVLDAIRSVPRHLFVDEALASRAYEDTALPIGNNQTISQPYIVARMSESILRAEKHDKVLEIGTGSGYQTAILARLFKRVYSIERIRTLYEQTAKLLHKMQVANISLRCADGYKGLPHVAPFDAIIITAAPPDLPLVLLEQLAPGGCMVVPVGAHGSQKLLRLTRQGNQFKEELLDYVSFVPMLTGRG
ncbi:MAG: protein-L-isoaspartate(D-aspartate) O-methyltransferase [Gammaproteobacteria bacterium]|nr:MAG: protein-L-isoaspartate(D-aspartate) O-methyltransferase [Gammaproteobacteria bacterium]RLA15280.1 MAG: protein-L-isoaspartate(D-aspartate) O-methyltransferase [Gammaproteobacteria bacterium]